MHQYLRAIGFSKIESYSGFKYALHEIVKNSDVVQGMELIPGTQLLQISKDFAVHTGEELASDEGYTVGVSLLAEQEVDEDTGDMIASPRISVEHYFPYVMDYSIPPFRQEIFVQHHIQDEAYIGVLDLSDYSVIFYLQNILNVRKKLTSSKELYRESINKGAVSVEGLNAVRLSALSTSGMVLMPLYRSEYSKSVEKHRQVTNRKLHEQTVMGNTRAVEKLVESDMKLNAEIHNRLPYDDILTIVDQSLLPIGIDSEVYEIIGDIESVKVCKNKFTNEYYYILRVLCGELDLPIAIHEKDLQGMPEKGRRFKGTIWLQGYILD